MEFYYLSPTVEGQSEILDVIKYDILSSCVVNAENESQARELADKISGDESRNLKYFKIFKYQSEDPFWLNSKLSKCEKLSSLKSVSGVLIGNFHAG